jgi:hypothetical protein
MKPQTSDVEVILAPDGFYPQAFEWQGSTVRVLGVEEYRTVGLQRRFRVRTPSGPFEIGLHFGTGIWHIHRRPGWLARAQAFLAAQPRYALPAGRRRSRVSLATGTALQVPAEGGGGHASRLALVRQ